MKKGIIAIISIVTIVATAGMLYGDWTGNTDDISTMGKVGIGTGTPQADLDVKGQSSIHRIYTTGNNVVNIADPCAADIVIGSPFFGGTRHDSSIMFWSSASASRISNAADQFYFSVSNNSNANVMLAATLGGSSYFLGNVGIGTTNPTSTLDVAGTIKANYLFVRPQNETHEGGEITLIGAGSNYGWTIDSYDDRLRIFTTSEKFTINSDGNVGIGDFNPDQKLSVNGNIICAGEIQSKMVSGYGQFRMVSGDYGVILRNDSVNTYFLSTNSGDKYGSWNSLRPFYFNNTTGNVALGGTTLYIQHGGNVGIGTTNPNQKLSVNGTIRANELIIDNNISANSVTVKTENWSDFVFSTEYRLRPLKEVDNYIKTNGRLPDMPSKAEVVKNGVNIAKMDAKLLQKVEELTLYMIDLKTDMADLKSENELLRQEIELLKKQIKD